MKNNDNKIKINKMNYQFTVPNMFSVDIIKDTYYGEEEPNKFVTFFYKSEEGLIITLKPEDPTDIKNIDVNCSDGVIYGNNGDFELSWTYTRVIFMMSKLRSGGGMAVSVPLSEVLRESLKLALTKWKEAFE